MQPRACTPQDPGGGDPELDRVLSPPSPHPKLASTLVIGCGEASQGGVLCRPHHASCPGSAEPEPGSVPCLPGYSAIRGRASVQSTLGRALAQHGLDVEGQAGSVALLPDSPWMQPNASGLSHRAPGRPGQEHPTPTPHPQCTSAPWPA